MHCNKPVRYMYNVIFLTDNGDEQYLVTGLNGCLAENSAVTLPKYISQISFYIYPKEKRINGIIVAVLLEIIINRNNQPSTFDDILYILTAIPLTIRGPK